MVAYAINLHGYGTGGWFDHVITPFLHLKTPCKNCVLGAEEAYEIWAKNQMFTLNYDELCMWSLFEWWFIDIEQGGWAKGSLWDDGHPSQVIFGKMLMEAKVMNIW